MVGAGYRPQSGVSYRRVRRNSLLGGGERASVEGAERGRKPLVLSKAFLGQEPVGN